MSSIKLCTSLLLSLPPWRKSPVQYPPLPSQWKIALFTKFARPFGDLGIRSSQTHTHLIAHLINRQNTCGTCVYHHVHRQGPCTSGCKLSLHLLPVWGFLRAAASVIFLCSNSDHSLRSHPWSVRLSSLERSSGSYRSPVFRCFTGDSCLNCTVASLPLLWFLFKSAKPTPVLVALRVMFSLPQPLF